MFRTAIDLNNLKTGLQKDLMRVVEGVLTETRFFFWPNMLCVIVKLRLGALQMTEVNVRFFSLNLGKSSLNLRRKGSCSHQRGIQLTDGYFGLRDLGPLRCR